jgi:cytochrome c peroxidase
MRHVVCGLAAAALASAAMAQPPDLFERHFGPPGPPGRDEVSAFRPDERLVLLGKKLFFDARLSGTGNTACASCHDPRYAYAEPRRVSISDNGRHGKRNAPSLVDVALLPRLMWDGNFRSLEEQALSPFQRGEMGIGVSLALRRVRFDRGYVHLFRGALGQRPMDRFLLGKEPVLSPLEHAGLQIFTGEAGCSNCHQPFPLRRDGRAHGRPLFTDFRFHNLGIGFRPDGFADPGRIKLSRIDADWGAFRTPSLRNVAMAPPYMHDGSLGTLEEVVEFYNAGGRPNPNLSPLIKPLYLDDYEKAALVAFLRALTDQGYED